MMVREVEEERGQQGEARLGVEEGGLRDAGG